MPPSPQEAVWTQTHPQLAAGVSGFWNSAPWIPLLALSPKPPPVRTRTRELKRQQRRKRKGGCSATSLKIFAGGRVQAACAGVVGPSLQGGGVSAGSRGSTLPPQPPGMQCQRPGWLSMTTQPPSPGRTSRPWLGGAPHPKPTEAPCCPRLLSTWQQGSRAPPWRPEIFACKQPLAVQAPGVSSCLSLSQTPFLQPLKHGSCTGVVLAGPGDRACEAQQFFFSLTAFWG